MSHSIIHSTTLRLAREIADISSTWPPGSAYVADQLKRAASSIVLNFAEGRGRATRKERERFFTIARGSACELRAGIELAHALALVDERWARARVRECITVSCALAKWGG